MTGHFHLPGVVHLAEGPVGRGELGPRPHVFAVAVGKVGPNQQLLLGPFFRTTCSGRTSSRSIRGSLGGETGWPAAIHSARTRYSRESTANRRPPLCGTAPVGLSRIRLRPGSEGTIRRPRNCRVIIRKSASGSYPRSESLKPFLPAAAPWQRPNCSRLSSAPTAHDSGSSRGRCSCSRER